MQTEDKSVFMIEQILKKVTESAYYKKLCLDLSVRINSTFNSIFQKFFEVPSHVFIPNNFKLGILLINIKRLSYRKETNEKLRGRCSISAVF